MQEELKKLCYDDRGEIKSKIECRAAIINYLIIDESLDIDDAEDLADKTMRELNLWPDPAETEAVPEA